MDQICRPADLDGHSQPQRLTLFLRPRGRARWTGRSVIYFDSCHSIYCDGIHLCISYGTAKEQNAVIAGKWK